MNISTPEPLLRTRPHRRRTGATTITKHRVPVCPESGKKRYRDRHQAMDALTSARRQGGLDLAREGTTQRRETRVWKCSCDGFHLTSLTEWNARPIDPELPLTSTPSLAAIRAIATASGFTAREAVAA